MSVAVNTRVHMPRVGLGRGLADLAAGLLAVQILLLGGTFAAPVVIGGLAVTVDGASMEPALSRGDIVIAKPVDVASVRLGDIVSFDQGGQVITHRVVSAEGEVLRTRGDAVRSLDSTPVTQDLLLGKAIAVVPLVGWPGLWRLQRNYPALITWAAMTALLMVLASRRNHGRQT